MREEGHHIAIPVTDVQEESTLLQILAELKKQTGLMQEQSIIIKQMAANVQSIWNQMDDTPVGFKINVSKL
jgi:hypothetical protein